MSRVAYPFFYPYYEPMIVEQITIRCEYKRDRNYNKETQTEFESKSIRVV